jgi:hypothetical protein
MSQQWWKSERSKTAAAVRSTRRRWRASFRASLLAAIKRETDRLESDYRARCARLAEAEQTARDVALAMSRPEIFVRDYQMQKLVGCEVAIHRDLFLRAKNPSEMIGAIAKTIGQAVEQKVFEHAGNQTRVFGDASRTRGLSGEVSAFSNQVAR